MSFQGQFPAHIDSSVRKWLHGPIDFVAMWYRWGNPDKAHSHVHAIERVRWVFGWRFEQSDPQNIKVCEIEGTLALEVKPSLMKLAAQNFGIEVVSREDLWTKEFFNLPGVQEGAGLVLWRNTPGFITGKPVDAVPNILRKEISIDCN